MKSSNIIPNSDSLARQKEVFKRLLGSDLKPDKDFRRKLMSISFSCMKWSRSTETAKEALSATIAMVTEQLYSCSEPFSDDTREDETQIKAFMFKKIKSNTYKLLKGAEPIDRGRLDDLSTNDYQAVWKSEILESLTDVLSERQIEVLSYLAKGHVYLDISKELKITVNLARNCAFKAKRTLKRYRSAIPEFQKGTKSNSTIDIEALSEQLKIEPRTLKRYHNAWLKTQK